MSGTDPRWQKVEAWFKAVNSGRVPDASAVATWLRQTADIPLSLLDNAFDVAAAAQKWGGMPLVANVLAAAKDLGPKTLTTRELAAQRDRENLTAMEAEYHAEQRVHAGHVRTGLVPHSCAWCVRLEHQQGQHKAKAPERICFLCEMGKLGGSLSMSRALAGASGRASV